MTPNELSLLVTFVGAFVVNGLITAALVAWGRWVAHRQGGGAGWRRLAWAPVLGFTLNGVGILLTGVGLLHAVSAVADAPPEQKVRLLSDGISVAMWATAICAPLSGLAYLGAVVGFVVGSVRRPRGAEG